MRAAIAATPPTTPPTIAPMFTLDDPFEFACCAAPSVADDGIEVVTPVTTTTVTPFDVDVVSSGDVEGVGVVSVTEKGVFVVVGVAAGAVVGQDEPNRVDATPGMTVTSTLVIKVVVVISELRHQPRLGADARRSRRARTNDGAE